MDTAMQKAVGGIAIWLLGGEDTYPGVTSQMWSGIRTGDYDGDGLTIPEENAYGTDPTRADTDEGGTSDPQEITDNTNPQDGSDDLDGDWDGDGLTTREENALPVPTDPNNPDCDDDGLTDGQEVSTYSTNPYDPDMDDYTFSDSIEVMCGSDPNFAEPPGFIRAIRINFQPASSSPPSGYCPASSAGFHPARGFGW
jgi:hypothetical protein